MYCLIKSVIILERSEWIHIIVYYNDIILIKSVVSKNKNKY